MLLFVVVPVLPDQGDADFLTGPDRIGIVLPAAEPGAGNTNFAIRYRFKSREVTTGYSSWQTTGQGVELSIIPSTTVITGLPANSDVQAQLTRTDATGRLLIGSTIVASTSAAGKNNSGTSDA